MAVAELEVLSRFGINLEGVFGIGRYRWSVSLRVASVDIAQFQSYHVASHAYLYYLANRTVCHVVIMGINLFTTVCGAVAKFQSMFVPPSVVCMCR